MSDNEPGKERGKLIPMTGGHIETADDIEYLEALGLLDRAEKPGNVRPRPFRTGRTTRIRVSAGETGERVGWFIGRIGAWLSGANMVDHQASERIQPSTADQRQPQPVPRNGEPRLRSLPRDTYQETLSPVRLLPLEAASGIQPDQAGTVDHLRGGLPLTPAPIAYLSSGFANGASQTANSDWRTRSLAGSRKWIMAAELIEILAQASPLRKVLRRIIGPRGADVLFLSTSVASLLLSFESPERVDGIALLMTVAQFTLGLLIEHWWVDLLFGITGIALFLLERHQHRRASFSG